MSGAPVTVSAGPQPDARLKGFDEHWRKWLADNPKVSEHGEDVLLAQRAARAAWNAALEWNWKRQAAMRRVGLL